ncbi:hypothetical protein B0H11DRAFT_317720 [Mycena galericulata]|nr:hypothetical protein B0H11DRAFT_317720 [Mycena galericulata]
MRSRLGRPRWAVKIMFLLVLAGSVEHTNGGRRSSSMSRACVCISADTMVHAYRDCSSGLVRKFLEDVGRLTRPTHDSVISTSTDSCFEPAFVQFIR